MLGTTNRSEIMVGWFIRNGTDDVPIQPLSGLYKTQVRKLASYLNIPEKIRVCAPSMDMCHGIPDECGIGIAYETLDTILDLLAKGVSESEIMAHDITPQNLALVCELHRLSGWKRANHPLRAPVDGGPSSDLRTSIQGSPSFDHTIEYADVIN